ncbi:MAG: helix-turn-helix transcriptional regulator [Clostridia bacterium]|nr:helix-turn-helix transcriptional regulator [Clostridia bacterium]
METSQRIRNIREDKDLTQQQVADGMGIKREQYRRYESGENEMKVSHIIRLCEFYQLSADYIIGITDKEIVKPER